MDRGLSTMDFKKTFTPQQALLKAASYCAYQERCYSEVEEKLAEWGVYGTDAGEIMIKLSEQNYLNEERFAKAFAGGKFRTKQWGRNKIIRELKMRKVSEYNIRVGLKEIDDETYQQTLLELITEKMDEVKAPSVQAKKFKTATFAISKGYESDLVWNLINKLS